MIDSISFKTRARTIDHLGREQIADCPTAVSELWKNAYDAYARNVVLHVFDGDVPIAAITDDGHGMSRSEFVDKWLVVGTDSKLTTKNTSSDDRCGLPRRERQGQKGIGRLSCAALGHLALIVSKRKGQKFVASMIDWKLFENPYLLLDDIKSPVIEFDRPDELPGLLGAMYDALVGNLWGDLTNSDRKVRIEEGWLAFDKLEKQQGKPSTKESIEKFVVAGAFLERHLAQWPVWTGQSTHGTVLLVAGLNFDLEALVQTDSAAMLNPMVTHARDVMFETLSSFVDPYEQPKSNRGEFHYSIEIWRGEASSSFLSDDRDFDFSNFEMLEHIIVGHVNEKGEFRGSVKAFGEWREGEVSISPAVNIPQSAATRVGAFSFRAGAYEAIRRNSTFSDENYAFVERQAERYSGLFLYRDELRVLPFGRPEYDFFEIEKRRTLQAGREFWSHRRMFGSIDISSVANQNLRDKAGREGLIDNQSAKVFREIVENILQTSAREYFGYDFEGRKPKLQRIQAANKEAKTKEAQKKLAQKRRDEFRGKVRSQYASVEAARKQLFDLQKTWHKEGKASEQKLLSRRSELLSIEANLHQLYVGDPPSDLQGFEADFKKYNAEYRSALKMQEILIEETLVSLASVRKVKPQQVFAQELAQRQGEIGKVATRLSGDAIKLLEDAKLRLRAVVNEYIDAFLDEARPIGEKLAHGDVDLAFALRSIDERYSTSRTEIEQLLRGMSATFEALRDNIDLSAIAGSGLDEMSELREEMSKINALAQLGITVEIIGHELEALDATVARGLKSFPKDFQTLRAYQTVLGAHNTLTDRLRFLSPLKLSGMQAKEWITGKEIVRHLADFFGDAFQREGVSLEASDEFRRLKIFDRKSRVLPVFINLANNSRYWLAQKKKPGGEIQLAIRNGKIIFADDGPGVEDSDVKNLFSLFFTRKSRGGRGVGLYLCRANLMAGGHHIWYAKDVSERVLSGANFVIELAGTNDV